MIKSIMRTVMGTIGVRVSGGGRTRFLSLLGKSKISVWDVHSDDEYLYFRIYRHSFIKLRPYVRKAHVRIHITEKKGIPHIIRNYRHRYGIIVGAVLFLSMFYFFSLFVWNIEVSGCERVSTQEVLAGLRDNGFSTGVFKGKLDVSDVENCFLKQNSKISWISINLKGTTAYVEIKEIPRDVELIDTSEPCSIYAARDGVISSVRAYMGYSVVSEGDTVTAGDLIVSGRYTDKYGGEYILHSYADVMAHTVHSKSVTVPYSAKEHLRTGRTKNYYSLKLIRFTIPLYFKEKILYNNYDITESEKRMRLSDSFVLPFSLHKKTYTEVDVAVCVKSREAAAADAYEQLRDFEYGLTGIKITDRHYTESESDGALTVTVMLDCYEDIGIQGIIQ